MNISVVQSMGLVLGGLDHSLSLSWAGKVSEVAGKYDNYIS